MQYNHYAWLEKCFYYSRYMYSKDGNPMIDINLSVYDHEGSPIHLYVYWKDGLYVTDLCYFGLEADLRGYQRQRTITEQVPDDLVTKWLKRQITFEGMSASTIWKVLWRAMGIMKELFSLGDES